MDALRAERVLTSGQDHTCRVWKVPEESQLIFRYSGALSAAHRSHRCSCVKQLSSVQLCGMQSLVALQILEAGQNCHTPYSVAERNSPSCRGYGQAIDCVAYVTGTEWVSGSSDGSLALWSQLKKKPVRTGSPPASERARHEAACGALDTRRA